uniref:Glutathione peroxidase n=1 Tax=Chromera velia CCMP2878 TaxID=1169474 RepID=A0A0G4GIV9_9ALVE|eukprot:Cvel_4760.t1-p1 / transcript=Cvel_4760.t1 / gene=Cvel_4760 / organism=Chromera_velia_CCMP2878 / gene_product=Phospholipid hydroperoxide glutathione peroxidase, putative / transcript_product=Phospholipid hydroperoxide glutathione peroxidase, putative / location=Cvel_scaffold212:46958-49196(-) / protein_length=200 / sequence_SO=supercontig / SO=protein_coding / is_pseudo=false
MRLVALLSLLASLGYGLHGPSKGTKCNWDGRRTIYEFMYFDIDGEKVHDLHEMRGKVVLLVNTASKGPQAKEKYLALNELHHKYEHLGLAVYGFPSNQFGNEPKDGEEILHEIELMHGSKAVPFYHMMKRKDLLGDSRHILFEYCVKHCGKTEWSSDFEMFIFDKRGRPWGRYPSSLSPLELAEDIKYLIYHEGGEHDEL